MKAGEKLLREAESGEAVKKREADSKLEIAAHYLRSIISSSSAYRRLCHARCNLRRTLRKAARQ